MRTKQEIQDEIEWREEALQTGWDATRGEDLHYETAIALRAEVYMLKWVLEGANKDEASELRHNTLRMEYIAALAIDAPNRQNGMPTQYADDAKFAKFGGN